MSNWEAKAKARDKKGGRDGKRKRSKMVVRRGGFQAIANSQAKRLNQGN